MSKLLWIVSAASVAISMPAAADAQGNGKGAGKPGHSRMAKGKVQPDRSWKGAKATRTRADARSSRTGASANRRVDRDGDGVPDYREGYVDRNRDGLDDRSGRRYAGNNCPPGLAKKTPACVPPGQAKRMFAEGQRVPSSFNNYIDYDDIPLRYRDDIPSQYGSDLYRYIRNDDSIYVVDRRTRIVSEIIDLLQ